MWMFGKGEANLLNFSFLFSFSTNVQFCFSMSLSLGAEEVVILSFCHHTHSKCFTI